MAQLCMRPTLLLLLISTLVHAKVAPSLSCSSKGVCFASGISTGAVLQRAPEKSALYGSITGTPGAKVTLLLSSVDGTYRKVYNTTAAADLTWKVLCDPMPTGGNFTATVSCTSGCTGRTSKTITDLTFGDVVFCAGQVCVPDMLGFALQAPHLPSLTLSTKPHANKCTLWI